LTGGTTTPWFWLDREFARGRLPDLRQQPGLTSGTVKYRVINASAASIAQYANGFDIYILPQDKAFTAFADFRADAGAGRSRLSDV